MAGNVDEQVEEELGRVELLASVLYGIAHNVELEGFKVLEGLGGPKPTNIVTSGGGGKNREWLTIRDDAFKGWLGVKGVVARSGKESEGGEGGGVEGGGDASTGAALIALRADGRSITS